MKTTTRSQIINILNEKSGTRPVDLVKRLQISPQAIHRHLKNLIIAGSIESRGRGPMTRYFIAGIPDFNKASRWYGSAVKPTENPKEFICSTRDIFAARLGHLSSLTKNGLEKEDLSLLISVVGEIGNNCFDHNLGQWQDVPGCWFEIQITKGRLWVCIADRGQGIFRSLSRTAPTVQDDQTALITAFEKTISGRAPESRGNGLKFVKKIVTANEKKGLACASGTGLVDFGSMGSDCRTELVTFPVVTHGTITLIAWRLK